MKERGLEDFLQKAGRKLSSNSSQVALQTVRDPWAVTPGSGQPLLVYVSNDLMIASPDLAELQHAVTRSQQECSKFLCANAVLPADCQLL